ncbi:MAG: peptidyl-tRNA hydrolase Pth2 [Thermoplasmata archaeon]
MEFKLVVAVREDLKLSSGKMAVQVAHAAVTCAIRCRKERREWFREWVNEGQRKVVVRARNLRDLHNLERKSRELKVTAALIEDAGLTELPPGTTTCLGMGPAPAPVIDQVTGQLRLW